MPSPSNANLTAVEVNNPDVRRRGWGATLEIWNEKLHYDFGLYLLLFIWLFSFTGLVLNHQWEIHNFWAKRQESTVTAKVQPIAVDSNNLRAQDLMRQLSLRGELSFADSPPPPGEFAFRVNKPGLLTDVHVD